MGVGACRGRDEHVGAGGRLAGWERRAVEGEARSRTSATFGMRCAPVSSDRLLRARIVSGRLYRYKGRYDRITRR